MLLYVLTLISAAVILASAFVAIRCRRLNAWLRLAFLAASAAFIAALYFFFGNTTQIYGLAFLSIAALFPLTDIKRHAEEQ